MIVDLTGGQTVVRDADDLKRLHVLATAALDVDLALRESGLGSQESGGRVLLDIARLRAAALGNASDPDWPASWDAMVAYAASKGWLADDGAALVAHVERTG